MTTAVATGHMHTVLATEEGLVFTCGAMCGSLGYLATEDAMVPKKVDALAKHQVVFVAAGNGFSAVVTAKGLVFVFGDAFYKITSPPSSLYSPDLSYADGMNRHSPNLMFEFPT